MKNIKELCLEISKGIEEGGEKLLDENTIYILPKQDKPVKVIFDDNRYKINYKDGLEFEIIDTQPSFKNFLTIVEIKEGLKIKVRDFILKEIQEEEYIKENFKLNIRRLNRWWYSIYFDKRED